MNAEQSRALNFLASMPGGNTTVERADAKAILMETGGKLMAHGSLYDIVCRNIGAGVCRLSLEPWDWRNGG